MDPFSTRDLRRTVTTDMARLGIPKPIHDLVQNHSPGDAASAHSDRWDGLPEKRAELRKWVREVLRSVELAEGQRARH